MKKIIFLAALFCHFSCTAQSPTVKDLSSLKDLNYIFARINPKNTVSEELYKRGLFVTIYELSDSKATPDEYMEDFLSSYIISVTPDGDYYYPDSKLYKIEGLVIPKILEIKEIKPPTSFTIKIEYGAVGERKIKEFKFEGVF